MSQSSEQMLLSQYTQALSAPDAVLEPNAANVVDDFLFVGGRPVDAVSALSQSYTGLAAMCEELCQTAEPYNIDCQALFREQITGVLVEQFNGAAVDSTLTDGKVDISEEAWQGFVQEPHWRQMIYRLLERHPRSEFLNTAVVRMAQAGYGHEVSQLKTTGNHSEILNLVLTNAFLNVMTKDDVEVDDTLEDFTHLCTEQEHVYIYVQVLLWRLKNKYSDISMTRLAKALERMASRKGHQETVDFLANHLSEGPSELKKSLQSLKQNKRIIPSDIITIYRLYSSENPPALTFIRDFDLINFFLKAVYVPDPSVILRPDTAEQIIYLIAHATEFDDVSPKDHYSDIENTRKILLDLRKSLNEARGDTFSGQLENILNAISTPVASLAILHWLEHLITETEYFETYFRSTEVPLPMLLLDEIVERQPAQQPLVFQVIKNCLPKRYTGFAHELHAALQRRWMERLVHLAKLGYVIPVLQYMRKESFNSKIDTSLTVHLITELLTSMAPPYSTALVDLITDILCPIVGTRQVWSGIPKLVSTFCIAAKKDAGELDAFIEKKILYILAWTI
ncbi:TH1 protein [Syncephalastrum racemosum]|uniref:TH1 protein n=1 Tax=Syncephalastrum racemosum TaxID=13706 RepID=A0A1X2HVN4_SYNRA|nr:TH1 protein [Syncephalastrum racemosum]